MEIIKIKSQLFIGCLIAVGKLLTPSISTFRQNHMTYPHETRPLFAYSNNPPYTGMTNKHFRIWANMLLYPQNSQTRETPR